jgi:hypothetical protein
VSRISNPQVARAFNTTGFAHDLPTGSRRYGITFRVTIDNLPPMWDNPTMIVTLDAKRRVSIPAALAPAAPGDQFEVTLRRLP